MRTREEWGKEVREQEVRLRTRMAAIKHKLAILSGKGGVGKSTFTANLATALSQKGYKVGILDADFHGPSIPKLLGIRGRELIADSGDIIPVVGPMGAKVVSMGLLLPSDEAPVIWRAPLKLNALRQFLADVAWGDLDFLLIDLPPGTGDEQLSIMQLIPDIDGVVMITAPSEVSQIVVKRAVSFAKELHVPVIGVVENMSGFICPSCGTKTDIFGAGGGQKIAEQMSVPFLGSVSLDPKISEDSDSGEPFVLKHSGSRTVKELMFLIDRIEHTLKAGDAKTW